MFRARGAWFFRRVQAILDVSLHLAAASLLSCEVVLKRWIQPHFAVSAAFSSGRWGHSVCKHVYTPTGMLGGSLQLTGVRSPRSVEVLKAWEVYDDQLRFIWVETSRILRDAIAIREVSAAWEIWSHAAESSLIQTFCLPQAVLSLSKALSGVGVLPGSSKLVLVA